MLCTLIHKHRRLAQRTYPCVVDNDVFIKKHLGVNSVISDQALMYSLVSFFSTVATISVKQLKFEIYIIFVGLKLSFLLGSKNKNNIFW